MRWHSVSCVRVFLCVASLNCIVPSYWKSADGDDEDDVDSSAFLSSNASLLGVAAGKLPQGQLQITRMKDANHDEISQVCDAYAHNEND